MDNIALLLQGVTLILVCCVPSQDASNVKGPWVEQGAAWLDSAAHELLLK